MKTAVINFKVDPKIKARAQKRASKLGISLSMVLNDQLRKFAEGEAVHVEFPTEQMTPHLEKLIEEVRAEVARGEVSPAFDNTVDAIAWLKQEVGDDD